MKKILIISNVSGGLYKFRKELIQTLSNKYQVTILASVTGNVQDFISMGCSFIELKLERHGINPLKEAKLLSELKQIIRNENPDIVLTYTIKPNVYGGIVCSCLKIPYIPNITGLGDTIENKGILGQFTRQLYKIGLKNAKKVFFQNQANCDLFLRNSIYKGDYEVIPGSGVNLQKHCYEPYPEENKDEPLRISVVGRITRDKGISEILEAAEQLKNENILIRLVGNSEGSYLPKIQEMEKEGILKYLGYQNNIHQIFAESHAVLHASYHEGMSNVLLEAASCGRPLIATNVPGCRETYDDGVSGISFEPKSTDALIKAVKTFIDLPYEKKAEMGKAGRKKMETTFNRKIIINKYLQAISQTIGE